MDGIALVLIVEWIAMVPVGTCALCVDDCIE
jgi:hypothetical protein